MTEQQFPALQALAGGLSSTAAAAFGGPLEAQSALAGMTDAHRHAWLYTLANQINPSAAHLSTLARGLAADLEARSWRGVPRDVIETARRCLQRMDCRTFTAAESYTQLRTIQSSSASTALNHAAPKRLGARLNRWSHSLQLDRVPEWTIQSQPAHRPMSCSWSPS